MRKQQTNWKLKTLLICLTMILFLFVNHTYADDSAVWNEIENRVRNPCYSDCSSVNNPDECQKGCDAFTDKAKGTIFACVMCYKNDPYANLTGAEKAFLYCCRYFSMDLGNIGGMIAFGGGSESFKKGAKIAYDKTMSTNWKEVAKNLP